MKQKNDGCKVNRRFFEFYRYLLLSGGVGMAGCSL